MVKDKEFKVVKINLSDIDPIVVGNTILLNSFIRIASFIELVSVGTVRALDVVTPSNIRESALNISLKLLDRMTEVSQSIVSDLELRSFYFDANILISSSEHLLELIDVVSSELNDTHSLVLFEFAYNVLKLSIFYLKTTLSEITLERDPKLAKTEDERLQKFKTDVIQGLWNYEGKSLQEKIAIMLAITSFLMLLVSVIRNSLYTTIKEALAQYSYEQRDE
jgi:hypothetical protein